MIFGFFGLKSSDIRNTYEEIFHLTEHNILTFTEAYNVPTNIRKFFVRRLAKKLKDEKEALDDIENSSENS